MNKSFISEFLSSKLEWSKNYTSVKALIRLYRVVFLAIGLFFFLLTVVVTKKTTNWSCSLLFANASLVKISISFLSSVFGFLALTLAFLLSAEREALSGIEKQAAKDLKKAYDKIKIEQNFHALNLGEKRIQSKKLSHTFSHTLDLIHQKKMDVFQMITNIKKRKDFDKKGKEQLINHALLHLQDELSTLVKEFNSSLHRQEAS